MDIKVKALISSVVILLVLCVTLFIRNENIKKKYSNRTFLEIAKEQIRQQKLIYQNNIYEARAKRDTALQIIDVYHDAFKELEEKDKHLHEELMKDIESTKSITIEELEKYWQDEFKKQ